MRVALCALAALSLFSSAACAGVVRGKILVPHRADVSLLEAVVWVDPLPDNLMRKWGRGTQTTSVVQQKRRFIPRVTAIPVGSTVRFLNHDDVYHNVFSVSPPKRFDLGKYPPSAINQVTFTRAGVVNLFCDIHPGMAAWVLVIPHRLFVRPTADGAFALPKLPPGKYTLLAWHPSFGRVTRRFVVPKRGDVHLTVRF